MPAIALTTELDAVNIMLEAIGESPVNQLATPGQVEVSKAVSHLHAVSREVQSKGWWFNEEHDYPLLPDTTKTIYLSPNMLKVTLPKWETKYTQRGNRLYNRDTHSYVVEQTLYATIVLFLGFEELPETARRYIAARAAKEFQALIFATPNVDVALTRAEMAAMAELSSEQDSNDPANMIYGDADSLETIAR